VTTYQLPDPGYTDADDLRHRPEPGGRQRDSLFWQVVMPDEQLAVQIYLYLTSGGRAGFNVMVWGPDGLVAKKFGDGRIPEEADLDDFTFEGLSVRQPELRRTAEVRFASEGLTVHYDFEAVHEAFSYRQNPDGLPSWFADNRLEQSGRVRGFVEFGGRRVEFDRMGHRDHSWGLRDWHMPQHWKWLIAYTESGLVVNGWIFLAKGEWGFGGYVRKDGQVLPIDSIASKAEYDGDVLQRRIEAEIVDVLGGRTSLVLERFGIFRFPTRDASEPVITEAACRATIDGVEGAGQFETEWPGEYLRSLIGAGG
jgi:hypothetical protein